MMLAAHPCTAQLCSHQLCYCSPLTAVTAVLQSGLYLGQFYTEIYSKLEWRERQETLLSFNSDIQSTVKYNIIFLLLQRDFVKFTWRVYPHELILRNIQYSTYFGRILLFKRKLFLVNTHEKRKGTLLFPSMTDDFT